MGADTAHLIIEGCSLELARELAIDLENEIEQRGLFYEYVYALFRQIDKTATASRVDRGWNVPQLAVWRMLRATPEQRAKAFLDVYDRHQD